eukprot:jgi/Botrbrau1/8118/Bobra.0308s0013.3
MDSGPSSLVGCVWKPQGEVLAPTTQEKRNHLLVVDATPQSSSTAAAAVESWLSRHRIVIVPVHSLRSGSVKIGLRETSPGNLADEVCVTQSQEVDLSVDLGPCPALFTAHSGWQPGKNPSVELTFDSPGRPPGWNSASFSFSQDQNRVKNLHADVVRSAFSLLLRRPLTTAIDLSLGPARRDRRVSVSQSVSVLKPAGKRTCTAQLVSDGDRRTTLAFELRFQGGPGQRPHRSVSPPRKPPRKQPGLQRSGLPVPSLKGKLWLPLGPQGTPRYRLGLQQTLLKAVALDMCFTSPGT